MIDDIPIITVGCLRVTSLSKLICYTDGLVEYSTEGKVVMDHSIIEDSIRNNSPIEENVNTIIKTRMEQAERKEIRIFDDISILGFDFR